MEISKAAHEECTVGDSDLAKKRAEKASGHIIALTNKDPVEQHPEVLKKLMRAMDADEHAGDLWAKIEKILFPGGIKTDNQRNDVRIVYSAAHYGTILVTDEDASKSQSGGILGNKHRLKELRIDVMTGDEAVELVRAQIAYRDSQTMLAHKNMRLPLPEWVGND